MTPQEIDLMVIDAHINISRVAIGRLESDLRKEREILKERRLKRAQLLAKVCP